MGDVPTGSVVYSNFNRRTYKVVKHCKNYTEVSYAEEPSENNTHMMKNDYLVVVKRRGEVEDLSAGAMDRVTTPTDHNFLVDFTDTDEGV